jgi:hypothetical protein
VDDPVGGGDVGLGDLCAPDRDLAAADADPDRLPVERLDRAALHDLGRGQVALGDVVEQDRARTSSGDVMAEPHPDPEDLSIL